MRCNARRYALLFAGVSCASILCAVCAQETNESAKNWLNEPESVRQYREVKEYVTRRSDPARTYEMPSADGSPAAIERRADEEKEKEAEIKWLKSRRMAVIEVATDYVNHLTTRAGSTEPGPIDSFQMFRALRLVDARLADKMERDLLRSVHYALASVEPAYLNDRTRLSEVLGQESIKMIGLQRGIRFNLVESAIARRDPGFIQGAMESVEFDDVCVRYLLLHSGDRPEIAEFLRDKHRDPHSRLSKDPLLEQRIESQVNAAMLGKR